jgi:transcriptional regulator of acetoin/glycerol metabolism
MCYKNSLNSLCVARLEPTMPYVSQTQHIDRVRGAIEGRLPAPADSARLVSSWQRSFEQYRLDPGAVIGPRVLTSAELREVQGKEEAFLRASGQCLTRPHDMIRVREFP